MKYEHAYVCMYVCMYACMYACMHACMCACMYVMHVCMYVCMYGWMRACIACLEKSWDVGGGEGAQTHLVRHLRPSLQPRQDYAHAELRALRLRAAGHPVRTRAPRQFTLPTLCSRFRILGLGPHAVSTCHQVFIRLPLCTPLSCPLITPLPLYALAYRPCRSGRETGKAQTSWHHTSPLRTRAPSVVQGRPRAAAPDLGHEPRVAAGCRTCA